MKFKELLEEVEKDEIVVVFINMHGSRFAAEHYACRWLEEENVDLMAMEIEKVRASNGKLIIYLKKNDGNI